jgi:hypothetical protein
MKDKIAFIAGHTRGGSTLLSILLGQQADTFAAGELHRIWRAGFLDNELCTCGKPFQECDFWNEVIRTAFGGWDQVNHQEMMSLTNDVFSAGRMPFLLYPSISPSWYKEKLNFILDVWGKLYQGIQKVSGSRIIVDSSKVSIYSLALNLLPDFDVHTIHLNRHSCGVAYSKQKSVKREEIYWETAYMDKYSPFFSSRKWVMRNLSAGILKYTTSKYFHLKYETLAESPQKTLESVFTFLDIPIQELSSLGSKQPADQQKGHMFGGNPMRFNIRSTSVRLDDTWKTSLPLSQKFVVYLITWPVLFLSGYR